MRGLSPVDPRHPAARQREAARQQHLLDALFDAASAPPHDAGTGWRRGLAAYRANAGEHAAQTLRARYPTVLSMLGGAAFDALAVAHWRELPPTRGDLARFGEHFPRWLHGRADLHAWPWLGDCARLDDAMWQVRFEPPSALSDADLRRLADHDPDSLALRLAPATRLLPSDWAVLTLRELHAAAEPDVRAVAQALRAGPQAVWVWRDGFDTAAVTLDTAGAAWIRALHASPTLGDALARADDGFDVGAWLQVAVRAGWIDGIDLVTPKESTT